MAIKGENAIYSRNYELQDVHLANDSPSSFFFKTSF